MRFRGVNRRGARDQTKRAAPPAPDTNVYGVTGWSASDFLATASPGGEASGGLWGFSLVIRPVNIGLCIMAAKGIWDLRSTAGNVFQWVQSGGVTLTGGAITAGQWNHLTVVCDGTNYVMYQSGSQTGTVVGPPAANSVSATYLGKRADGFAISATARIAGMITFTGAPVAADVLAHYNACKAAADVVNMTGTGVAVTHKWSARQSRAQIATGLADLVGSDTLTTNGTGLSVAADNAPVWV